MANGAHEAASKLPIWAHRSEICKGLREKDVLLLVGETGSGKSTQLPQFLLDERWNRDGVIAITQPRRVAAISLARRVAFEMKSTVGKALDSRVGYSVRFDHSVSPNTRIKFLTEGMLLQEMLRDPWLKQYSAVVVDEVHERSVNVDLILGFLRRILTGDQAKHRPGGRLKTVVMSATADIQTLHRFFQEGFGEDTKVIKTSNGNAETRTTPAILAVSESLPEPENHASGDKKRKRKPKSMSRAQMMIKGYTDPVPSRNEEGKPQKDQQTVTAQPQTLSKGLTALPALPESRSIACVYVQGRQHKVEVKYLDGPAEDFAAAALKTIFHINKHTPLPGDVLVFLPGQDTIETVKDLVDENAKELDPRLPKLLALPLYAALPQHLQDAIFRPAPQFTRKIILATNIAETSVTIPGIRHVVDSGLHKMKEYRSTLNLDSLLVKPISKSSAIQRMGRAGREAPGTCHRLFTAASFKELEERTRPEILRSDLGGALLTMKARHVEDVLDFPFLDHPGIDNMKRALLGLLRLGALQNDGSISRIGTQMARMPLPPALSRVLIAAAEADILLEAIDIVAALTVENVFLPIKTEEERENAGVARRNLLRREGDHLTLLAAVQGYTSAGRDEAKRWSKEHLVSHRAMQNVLNVRRQLRGLCISQKLLAKEQKRAKVNSNSTTDSKPTNTGMRNGSHGTQFYQDDDDDSNSEDSTGRITIDEYEGDMKPYSPELASALLRCLLRGFMTHTARLMPDNTYQTLHGAQTVTIHPSSVLFGRKVEAIVYNELVFTKRSYARAVSAIQLDWYEETLVSTLGHATR